MADIYGGRDPRSIPSYQVSEVARWMRTPESTLKKWILGPPDQTVAETPHAHPLIELPDPGSLTLSFINLVEIHVLISLQREDEIPLPTLRLAIDDLRDDLSLEHPLAARRFQTDGIDHYIETIDRIHVPREDTTLLRAAISAYLNRIEWDPEGKACRLYPFTLSHDAFQPEEWANEPKIVMIDPTVAFGQPVLKGSRIPTESIVDRFLSGDDLLEIADDYGRDLQDIQAALRYEMRPVSTGQSRETPQSKAA